MITDRTQKSFKAIFEAIYYCSRFCCTI